MSDNKKIRVGITQGDINGIGYEIILKTFSEPTILELCVPIIYGSSKVMGYHRNALNFEPININIINSADNLNQSAVNIINVGDNDAKVDLGHASKEAGEQAFAALEAATEDIKNGKIDVIVTAPINKDSIQNDQFKYPGHTEYLEAKIGGGAKSLMILCNDRLRVALVTTHLPVSQIAEAITKANIVEKLSIFERSLRADFAIVKPRIAVLSLNPHAGENGLLGEEENTIITPAIAEANEKNILCFGPYASDGFFGTEQYKHFDGVLAMYHDQGLTPFKTIAMEAGVNITAGLPYVRTSPDHGTGYDIAGQGVADEQSFRQAIYMAIDIYRNRKIYKNITANPLRKQYYDKSGDNEVLDLTKETDKEN